VVAAVSPIDSFLDDLAIAIAGAAPGVARALYVTGSQATGDAVRSSDVDVCAIVEEAAHASDVRRLVRAAREHAALSGHALDLAVLRASELPRYGARAVAIRLGGRRFHGTDLAELVPLPSVDAYVAARMDEAACLVAFALRAPRVVVPLDYPDAADELRGYARASEPRMRDAVTVAGWAFTALLANRERVYVPSKTDALRSYAKTDAPFASFAAALVERCRSAWAYGVPDHGPDREHLRALCTEMLAFERYFLGIYAEHLATRLGPRVSAVAPSAILERALHAMLE
jgi:hypothetical protein